MSPPSKVRTLLLCNCGCFPCEALPGGLFSAMPADAPILSNIAIRQDKFDSRSITILLYLCREWATCAGVSTAVRPLTLVYRNNYLPARIAVPYGTCPRSTTADRASSMRVFWHTNHSLAAGSPRFAMAPAPALTTA